MEGESLSVHLSASLTPPKANPAPIPVRKACRAQGCSWTCLKSSTFIEERASPNDISGGRRDELLDCGTAYSEPYFSAFSCNSTSLALFAALIASAASVDCTLVSSAIVHIGDLVSLRGENQSN